MGKLVNRLLDAVMAAMAPMLVLRVSWATRPLPRPIDSPHARASGSDPDRILLFGGATACGYGVLSHDLSLAGHLARRISAATGRGVDVDVVADAEMTMRTAPEKLSSIALVRYDAIVVTLGVNDALRRIPARAWRQQLAALIEHIMERTATDAHIFLVRIQPIRSIRTLDNVAGLFAEAHARVLDREMAKIAAAHTDVTFVPFILETVSEKERYRTSSTYAHWASLLAPTIISGLSWESREDDRIGVSCERDRQEALESLHILDTEPEKRFDRISNFALRMFNTDSATISFIDNDREWMKTRPGFPLSENPRTGSFSEQVLQRSTAFVVRDAVTDERFADNVFVTGPPYVRFYAGHALRAPNGQPVGVLAVFHSDVLAWTEADSLFLRDLAHLVEDELRTRTR
ncbi:MAG: diguanylate cyclase [Homoserinimonas sp.]|jgi:lysophospholipase L1-like esterase|nr:diguanylate cyclase [Homoserinimonas sp.]